MIDCYTMKMKNKFTRRCDVLEKEICKINRHQMIILISLLLIHLTSADIFSSIAHLEKLVDLHQEMPTIIENYIAAEESRLQNLRKLAIETQKPVQHILKVGVKSLENPINAFLLIKSLVLDWKEVEDAMKRSANANILNHTIIGLKDLIYPSDEDLNGAAVALHRLQDVYRLSTKDLANGKIFGEKSRQHLSAKVCYVIGRVAYLKEDFYHTILWMQEAYDRIKKEENYDHADLEEILEHLSFSLFKQGNLKRALLLTDELYKIAPNHPRAAGNIEWYENMLREEGIPSKDLRRNIPSIDNQRSDHASTENHNIYEALCRNEVPVSSKEVSKVYCYYKSDRPYLLLAPFKVEILRFNPLAVIFRDVISDEETESIQQIAHPMLRRATVQNSITGNLETASYRISKSAWLKSGDYEVVDRINRRIDLMTNLEEETAEELQIANYGLGGQYEPHYDFARKEDSRSFDSLGTGNRIATVLFYMTQPQIGGATVFTDLKTVVLPSKNDALFWYNLFRSGEGDLRTRHAACPVLIGVKWVANKWIHEAGQEFRRPCGLYQYDEEEYVSDLGGPSPKYHQNIRNW